jgi:phage gpG-like protein
MLKVKIQGFDETRKTLDKLNTNIQTLTRNRVALNAVGVFLSAAAKKRISEGGLPPFKPLKAATVAQKHGGAGQILIDSGIGRRSVTTEVQGGELYYVLNRYMAAHHFGFKGTVDVPAHRRKIKGRNIGRGKKKTASGVAFVKAHQRKMNLPERPFLGILNAQEERSLGDILVKYLAT